MMLVIVGVSPRLQAGLKANRNDNQRRSASVIRAGDSWTSGVNSHKRALLSGQLRSCNLFFAFTRKQKLSLTAAKSSETRIQLMCLNPLTMKQKMQKAANTRGPGATPFTPLPLRSPLYKASPSKVKWYSPTLKARLLEVEGFTPAGGASCAEPGGRNGRSCARSRGTGTVWPPCVYGSAASAHRNGRTSKCSLPRRTCKVSHLKIRRNAIKLRSNVGRASQIMNSCCWRTGTFPGEPLGVHQHRAHLYRCLSCEHHSGRQVALWPSHRCVCGGEPWGASSWCTPCCTRKSHSGEFASFSACRVIQQEQDVVCPSELLPMGYCPWKQETEANVIVVTRRGRCGSRGSTWGK